MAERDLNVSIASTGRTKWLSRWFTRSTANLRIYVSEIRRCPNSRMEPYYIRKRFSVAINEIRDSPRYSIFRLRSPSAMSGTCGQDSRAPAGGVSGFTGAEQASTIEQMSAMVQRSRYSRADGEAHRRGRQQDKVRGFGRRECNRAQQLGAMDEIEKASNEISKIIKAIEDVPDEHPALNAAVEAAGRKCGKGCQADEVRNPLPRAPKRRRTRPSSSSTVNAVCGHGSCKDRRFACASSKTSAMEAHPQYCHRCRTAAMSVDQVNMGRADKLGDPDEPATAEESAAASQE